MVLCKTPRVSVFGPHTRESLAEAKWTKVNKSGHYVWAPVNSCSLVSLCFKKRGGRCDHEESPCLFFSSHYRERGRRRWGGRWGLALLLCLPPSSSSSLPLSAFSPCFLFLSLPPLPLSPSLQFTCVVPLLPPRPSPPRRLALPAQCSSNMQEGRDQWCPRRGNYTAEFR